VLLIEDASQGLGSSWGGVDSGAHGDMSVLSFGRGKGWTGGGGGALLLRQRGLSEDSCLGGSGRRHLAPPGRREEARAFATCLAMWVVGRPWLYGLPASVPWLGLGETVYSTPGPVTGIAAYAAQAAFNLAGPSRRVLPLRRAWADTWTRLLGEYSHAGVARCLPLEGGESGYLRYPVLADGEDRRSQLLSTCRSAGAASGYPRRLPELRQARELMADPSVPTPGASTLSRRLLTLPTHPWVARHDVERVTESLKRRASSVR
jgi:dTDP-4-amino-4,6-dideoxygalactose transaminase